MSDAAVDRALAIAERRAGVGQSGATSTWARERARAVLERQASRHSVSLDAAAALLASDPSAIEELVVALRVGETRFYRDRIQWEALEQHVVPALPAGEIAALSAGSSTGEEAYTLAMLLANAGRRDFRVHAVDRSPEALETARAGVYASISARDLPPEWRARFCEERPTQNGATELAIVPSLRAKVTFERLDLSRRAPKGPFHLVLFKNVILYLATPVGEDAARRLARELAEDGVLLTATSEVGRLRAAGLPVKAIAAGVVGFARGQVDRA